MPNLNQYAFQFQQPDLPWQIHARVRHSHVGPAKGAMILWFLLAAAAHAASGASIFKIVAQSGQDGLVSIKRNVSINDSGLVAFAATTANGISVLVGDGNSPPRSLTTLPTAGAVDPFLQINNAGMVAAERGPDPPITSDPIIDYVPILGPILVRPGTSDVLSFVQLYDANNPNSGQLVAQADWHSDDYLSYMDYTKVGAFSYLGPAVSVNNLGATAFVADTGVGFNSSYVLAIPGKGADFAFPPSWLLAQPMIADTGEILVKEGPAASAPIVLYSQDLSLPKTVAPAAMGFVALGNAPGISDDGQYIAFYGELNAAGAAALQTTPGPGIFLAGRTPGGFSIRRIVGLEAADGTPQFSSFDAAMRVGVNRQSQDGSVLLVFAAADASGLKGVWAALFDASDPAEFPLSNILQAGDQIGNIGPCDDFCLADPVNVEGQVACWAKSGNQQAVLRAKVAFFDLKVLDANPQFLGEVLLPAQVLDQTTLNAIANASLERTKATADGATRLLLRVQAPAPGWPGGVPTSRWRWLPTSYLKKNQYSQCS
ncbi:MAG: hypothetical protein ABSH34_32635 [Verrucomicrobiota bacterium]